MRVISIQSPSGIQRAECQPPLVIRLLPFQSRHNWRTTCSLEYQANAFVIVNASFLLRAHSIKWMRQSTWVHRSIFSGLMQLLKNVYMRSQLKNDGLGCENEEQGLEPSSICGHGLERHYVGVCRSLSFLSFLE